MCIKKNTFRIKLWKNLLHVNRWRHFWKQVELRTRLLAGTFNQIPNISWEQEWNRATPLTSHLVTTVNLLCSKHVSFIKQALNHALKPIIMFLPNSFAFVFPAPSLLSILKITVPVLCLILIICTSLIYFWFNR